MDLATFAVSTVEHWGEHAGLEWFRAKTFLEHSISFADDALHIWAGVAIQLVVALLLRRSIASIWPVLAVFVLELANEGMDLRVERWPDLSEQLGEGFKDVLLTMALPVMLLLVSRWLPRLLADPSKRRA